MPRNIDKGARVGQGESSLAAIGAGVSHPVSLVEERERWEGGGRVEV